eukprot:c10378_g1_i1 orf=218-400(+)
MLLLAFCNIHEAAVLCIEHCSSPRLFLTVLLGEIRPEISSTRSFTQFVNLNSRTTNGSKC